jgi:hypothetical protein
MTPQEAQMLEDLVRKVEGTPLTEKDPDAEALLYDGLARDPDAIYKLAQTVLIQNLALNQARAQINQLQQQSAPQQPAKATSFLGSLLHRNQPQPSQAQPQYAPPPPSSPPAYQAVPPYQAAPQGYYDPAPSSGGAGSFLRSAATTAAGVAAGALAFEGIESLMHGGFGHGGEFGGGGFGGYGSGAPVEETVVNNYYDSPQGGEREASYGSNGPDEQPQGPYGGPDEQPQGPYEASDEDEQPQGPYNDDPQLDDASYDPGDDAGFSDDSGGDSGVI